MKSILIYSLAFLLWTNSCKSSRSTNDIALQAKTQEKPLKFVNMHGDTIKKIEKTPEEWRKILTDQEYHVLRQKGTERAFTGDLLDNKVDGLYTCRGCGMPLFSSKHKFDSGSGWPSFYDLQDSSVIHKETDYVLGYARIELSCAKCGCHLGHVFDDGPRPTGKRYCINSVSLDFIKSEH